MFFSFLLELMFNLTFLSFRHNCYNGCFCRCCYFSYCCSRYCFLCLWCWSRILIFCFFCRYCCCGYFCYFCPSSCYSLCPWSQLCIMLLFCCCGIDVATASKFAVGWYCCIILCCCWRLHWRCFCLWRWTHYSIFPCIFRCLVLLLLSLRLLD